MVLQEGKKIHQTDLNEKALNQNDQNVKNEEIEEQKNENSQNDESDNQVNGVESLKQQDQLQLKRSLTINP